MKLAVCDDLPQQRQELIDFLTRYGAEQGVDIHITEYDNGDALLRPSRRPLTYDLIFLDIYMEGQSGIACAKALRRDKYKGEIVFFTNSPDFAVESYDVEASGYLVKPFSYEQLCRVMDRVMRRCPQQPNTITISVERIQRKLAVNDIIYAETADHGTVIHLPNDELRLRMPISELEALLAGREAFLRCHRSYLVNMDYVSNADSDFFYLKNGDKILVSVRSSAKLRKQLANYIWKKVRE